MANHTSVILDNETAQVYIHTTVYLYDQTLKIFTSHFLPDRISWKGNAISSCPSVCFYFTIFWAKWPLNLTFWMCMVITLAHKELKVAVNGYG